MNEIERNGKTRGSGELVPGCLGRMVNLFALTSSISGNRRLTDKPYNDGSSLSRSRSDISRISSVVIDEMEDKVMVSDLTSSSNINRTPVKMLIAQELSDDLESDQKSTNVVAKLMGLDAIPLQNPNFPAQRRIRSRLYTRNSHSEIPIGYWKDEHGFFNNKIDCNVHSRIDGNEYNDMYEILQQSNCKREKASQKGRSNENFSERKLELIREKFMEAKRLATDEKLRETKEFQEALDVLSSNKDLFLKVLQEPNNSFISQSNTKRITVLKPSKTMNDGKFGVPIAKRCEKQVKNQVLLNRANAWESRNHGFSPTIQPTQIVVLKPGPGKANESKARIPPSENFLEEVENEEAQEVAKEITQQMREHLAGHSRDETLILSVLSNGYREDESSFEQSENETGLGNLSDFEVMSPISRHSWDYVDRVESPFSSVSCGPASYSLESSVCREAKRRLSERWAMLASNQNNNNNNNIITFDQTEVQRSSSTLGEMLALSEVKKPEICKERDNKDRDQMGSSSSPSSNMDPGESGNDFLSRSKSAPVSCTDYGERLNMEIIKPKTSKSSFTGRVTNLFFSRNKKSKKENPRKSSSNNESQLSVDEVPGFFGYSVRTSNDHLESVLSPTSRSLEGFCVFQPVEPFLQGENQEQPSPISVLKPPFQEDDSALLGCSRSTVPNTDDHIPSCLGKSYLIDKSPPIGSIARTLSWDDSFTETVANYPLDSPYVPNSAENNEVEYLYLVQSLLTMAGLNKEEEMYPNLTRWHSLDTPLDPLLRDKYINLSTNEPLHEAKRRQLRSSRKLVFDCVSAALIDITVFGPGLGPGRTSCSPVGPYPVSGPGMGLKDKVWAWVKELLPSEVKYLSVDGGDNHGLVENLVRKDVRGNSWSEQIKLQEDNFAKEIEGQLLVELVEESVVEWIGR